MISFNFYYFKKDLSVNILNFVLILNWRQIAKLAVYSTLGIGSKYEYNPDFINPNPIIPRISPQGQLRRTPLENFK